MGETENMVEIPRELPAFPQGWEPWMEIEVPGYGPANLWELEELRRLQREGVTSASRHEIADRSAGRAGLGAETAEESPAADVRSRGADLVRFAQLMGISAVGAAVLAILVILVVQMVDSGNDSASTVSVVPASAAPAEQDPDPNAVPVDSVPVDVASGSPNSDVAATNGGADDASGDGDDVAPTEETDADPTGSDVEAESDSADASEADEPPSNAAAVAPGRYTGSFLGPVFADQPDNVVGAGSTVDLVMAEDGTVSGSIELGILWSGDAFECTPPPDEFWGDVGPVDVSSGAGQAPAVLSRFFLACGDSAEVISWDVVLHVVAADGKLTGGLEMNGVVGLPWEATPAS